MSNSSVQTRPSKSRSKKIQGNNNSQMDLVLTADREARADSFPESISATNLGLELPVSQACPYLGKKSDPSTFYQMAVSNNYCHHCQSPASPLLDYQQIYCLKAKFELCPVYSHLAIERFPHELVNYYSPGSNRIMLYLAGKFQWLRGLLPG